MHSLPVMNASNTTADKPTFLVIRQADGRIGVTTNVLLADGSYWSDVDCALTGNVLKSVERPGHIRVGGLIKLTLGPVSLAKVQALLNPGDYCVLS